MGTCCGKNHIVARLVKTRSGIFTNQSLWTWVWTWEFFIFVLLVTTVLMFVSSVLEFYQCVRIRNTINCSSNHFLGEF